MTTSNHAKLLNELDVMQQSPVYATRRSVLQQAEQLIIAQEKSIVDLEERKTGPGTPIARLTGLLDALAARFPEEEKPFQSDPPELRYLQAIDALIGKS